MGRRESEEDSSTLSEDVAELSIILASTNFNMAESNQDAAISPPAMPIAIPVPESLPTTMTQSYCIQNVPTHAFCQVFSDRIVVGITQLPSLHVGNWINCQATMSSVDPKAIEWDVATLLGNHNDPSLEVYARRIIDCIIQKQCIPGTSHVAILLGISLLQTKPANSPDEDRSRFHLIVETLVGLIEEALMVALFKSNKQPRC
jgi:hypothetical protein